ncbi:MAG: hypothetical protein ABJZ55_16195 [Fuerstiella sp.]
MISLMKSNPMSDVSYQSMQDSEIRWLMKSLSTANISNIERRRPESSSPKLRAPWCFPLTRETQSGGFWQPENGDPRCRCHIDSSRRKESGGGYFPQADCDIRPARHQSGGTSLHDRIDVKHNFS